METIKEIILVTVMVVLIVLGIFWGVKLISDKNYNQNSNELLQSGNQIVENLNKTDNTKLGKYVEKYGDRTTGYIAYALSIIRFYSIPICVLLFVIGFFLYYIAGQEKFVESERGYGMIVASIFFFVIAQVAPLIYSLIVTFGRS